MSFLNTVIRSSKNIYGTYSVTLSVNTETSDWSSGQKTNSFATATSLTCAFFKASDEKGRNVLGDELSGDASLLCEHNSSIARNDKIVVTFADSTTETYLVKRVEPSIGTKCKIVELELSE